MLVYVLSVAEDIKVVLIILALVSTVCGIVPIVKTFFDNDMLKFYKRSPDLWPEHKDTPLAPAPKSSIRVLWIAAMVLLLSTLIPTRRALMEAYLITEAPKVINAENAEAVTKDISAKFDKLIDGLVEPDSKKEKE